MSLGRSSYLKKKKQKTFVRWSRRHSEGVFMYDCRVYLIAPPVLAVDFAALLAAALDAGDVAAFQLRLADPDEDGLRRAIDMVRPIAHARGVALILNNRPDLVVQTGCDGAHVGATDMGVAEARRLLGPTLQLGASCYDSRDLALKAGEAGADYISFGTFFPSTTKAAEGHAEVELLSWWSELMEPPVVAAGGIDAENCGALVRAGANFLAVSAAVWNAPGGPSASVRALNAAIASS
jgi:thiamine-phosphate pyrophosphorylase